jgi:NAD(P)-dependent dehydrogenase (short-subunit alcohol dehydrogenase family)
LSRRGSRPGRKVGHGPSHQGQGVRHSGGVGGIGLDTARLLAAEGARVAIIGRSAGYLTAAVINAGGGSQFSVPPRVKFLRAPLKVGEVSASSLTHTA